MIKPFLILQLRPEDEASDNEFEAFLKYGQMDENEVKRLRIEKTGIPQLDLDAYSGIIVGGSPFDISTIQEKKSFQQLKIEEDFHVLITEVIERDMPFLGACSGCGLLGDYCGATISGKNSEPVSGVDVHITPEGEKDALLEGLSSPFRALVGHKEACDRVPECATLLASSEACPVQMFRVGDNVYATQFHPEADAEVFIVRINAYKQYGYFSPDDAEALIKAIHQENTPMAQEILRRFVERYKKVNDESQVSKRES